MTFQQKTSTCILFKNKTSPKKTCILPPQAVFTIIFMKQVHGKLIVKIVHALPRVELMGTCPKLVTTNLNLTTTTFLGLHTSCPEQFRPQSSATTRRRDSQFHNFTDTRRMMKLKLHPQVNAADDPMLRLIYQAIIILIGTLTLIDRFKIREWKFLLLHLAYQRIHGCTIVHSGQSYIIRCHNGIITKKEDIFYRLSSFLLI